MALSFIGIERDRLAAVTDADAFYNVQIKKYGSMCKVTCWDTLIYNPDKVERFVYPVPSRPPLPTQKSEWDKLMLAAGNYLPRTDNLNRAKNKVYDIAFANKWQYFVTCTLDAAVCDRYDVLSLKRFLRAWLGNRVQRDGLLYLGVPERHKDGALHLHFLVSAAHLGLVDSGTVLCLGRERPVKRATALRAGYAITKTVYNWPDWPLGYSTAIPVDGNSETVAGYLAKYINKGQERIFGKRYLAGGKICRKVPTLYARWDFDAIDARVYEPTPKRRVKYMTLDGVGEGWVPHVARLPFTSFVFAPHEAAEKGLAMLEAIPGVRDESECAVDAALPPIMREALGAVRRAAAFGAYGSSLNSACDTTNLGLGVNDGRDKL